jgi:tRNA-modifying protein YgfZ
MRYGPSAGFGSMQHGYRHLEGMKMMADSQEWLASLLRGESLPALSPAIDQARAVSAASVVCRLDGFSLLRVSGEDAETFLHGQLSSDVHGLGRGHAQFSSYSTAKGRVMASFLLWRRDSDFHLLVSSDIAAAICKRLSMFVMRSKVRIEIATDLQLIGAHGPVAETWLSAYPGLTPSLPLECGVAAVGAAAVRLPSGALLLTVPTATAQALAQGAGDSLQGVDFLAWSLLDIAAGIPWITQPTQEQFVAQMLNMDIYGALSFTKGCYPGQEIIARTRYLGKVKRRMYRVELPCQAEIGSPLYSPETADQSIGMVVNAAQNDSGKYVALIVVQTAAWDQGVYLDVGFKQAIVKQSLPYTLSDE